jgi:hypothetical protein
MALATDDGRVILRGCERVAANLRPGMYMRGDGMSAADPDGALLGASLAFAGAAVLGSVVAVRDQLPGEPLGVGISLSVPAGLLAGWGPR